MKLIGVETLNQQEHWKRELPSRISSDTCGIHRLGLPRKVTAEMLFGLFGSRNSTAMLVLVSY